MPKVTINLLGYNHRPIIGKAIESVLRQTYRDFELIYMDNASADDSVEYVKKTFSDVVVMANDKNLGYCGGHNLFFASATSEFVMVLNPDAEFTFEFLERALPVFDDPTVGAVTGKMIRPQSEILDGTGITVDRMRRAKERGQNESDEGQYDTLSDVFGVSGTAAIYRRSALEQIKVPTKSGGAEYFDEDFFAYFEDIDLSWRLRLAGYKAVYVPAAIVYHTRLASSSPGGYKKLFAYIKHHRNLPEKVKQWNWKNHLFCIVKNDFGWTFWRDLPRIVIRELAMFFFMLIFETRTLGVVPEFFKQLPDMIKKRKYIQAHRQVDSKVASEWFV